MTYSDPKNFSVHDFFKLLNDFIFLLEPRGGPANVLSAEVNKTTVNISWAPLLREQTNGDIILYNVKEELLSRGTSQKRSSLSRKNS